MPIKCPRGTSVHYRYRKYNGKQRLGGCARKGRFIKGGVKEVVSYNKGWFNESDRHRLARLGIKTGRKITGVGIGLSKNIGGINYAKLLSSSEFRINDNTTIVCRSEDTRSGFRHIADLYRDGSLVESAKATYLNRTWEKYEFQSVIKELLNKAGYNETEQDKIMNKIERKALGKVDEQFKSVAMVASLGDIFGKSQKEKNKWKLRMIKAGLGGVFQEPDDWNTLSEEEKGKRLDKIIKLMKDKNKTNYAKKSKKTTSLQLETGVSVGDYLKNASGDIDSAFELSSEDIKGAIKNAKEDLKEFLGKDVNKVKITDVKFLEWDSGNISHAGGYYSYKIKGPSDLINKVKKGIMG